MKNFLRYILPVLVVVAIFAFMTLRDPAPDQIVGDIVASDTGTEELLDFLNSIADGQYDHASQYVLENCETDEPYCLKSDLSKEEISVYLKEMCETNFCENAELDQASDSANNNVYTHYVAFLNDEGVRERVCMDSECKIQKMTFGFRAVKDGDRWYIIDTPPIRVN